MSNSALTGNTSGLATATSPGLVGTTAQTFGGKKTLDGGALIKGDITGLAVAAGYVGEVIRPVVLPGSNQSITSTSFVAITGASMTLQPGTYLMFATTNFEGPSGALIASLEIWNGTSQIALQDAGCILSQAASSSIFISIQSAAATTYTLRAKVSTGTISITGFSRPSFMAVRIA